MTDTNVRNADLNSRDASADPAEAATREAPSEREEAATNEDGKVISVRTPTIQQFGSFA